MTSTTTVVPLSQLKANPENPRIIKDAKFRKLVKSLEEFPDMLELRPIVVDETWTVLGGNMRLKALQAIRVKEVPVTQVLGLTEEQKHEFIIKDNASFGEWDWDVLANEWNADRLQEWGIDVPSIDEFTGVEEQEIQFSEYLDEANNYVVLLFRSEVDWLSAQTHFGIQSVHSMRANGKPWSKGIGRVIDGAEYLKRVTSE